jgi:hypothetical protein
MSLMSGGEDASPGTDDARPELYVTVDAAVAMMIAGCWRKDDSPDFKAQQEFYKQFLLWWRKQEGADKFQVEGGNDAKVDVFCPELAELATQYLSMLNRAEIEALPPPSAAACRPSLELNLLCDPEADCCPVSIWIMGGQHETIGHPRMMRKDKKKGP